MNKLWEIGPLEIAPGDLVKVFYTGTNTSDTDLTSLDTETRDKIEIKILDTIFSAGAGALVAPLGVLGSIIGGASAR